MHISDHASRRAQQRSVSRAAIAVVMRFADIEHPNTRGRRSFALSAKAVAEAHQAGFSTIVVEEASTTVLVVASDDTVVTVLRGNFSRRVRKARRPSRCHSCKWSVR
jgi:hypothetical protein